MRQSRIWVLTSLLLGGLLGLAFMSLAQDSPWVRKANMPTPRTLLSTAMVNGIIYAIGGWGTEELIEEAEDEALAVVEAYDPVTDTWTRRSDMPSARGELAPASVVSAPTGMASGSITMSSSGMPYSPVAMATIFLVISNRL